MHRDDSPGTGRHPLSRDAAQLLVQHIAVAAARGVPLPDVLEALAEDMGDRRLSAAAHDLAEQIRSGATLEEALAALGPAFPPRVRGVLLAGARAGDLPLVLEGYAALERQRRHVHGVVRSALVYPVLIAALLIPVLTILGFYIAPVFEELFRDFDLNLPEATVMAFRTAHFAPFALGALLAVPVATALLLSLIGGHWLMHRLRGATPVFGPLWTWAGQNELASLLGLFVAARLPLDQAVEITSHALSDRNVARACPYLAEAVTRGMPLGEALDRSMHFDRTLAPLVLWGEQNGLLEDALVIASSVLRDRLEGYAAMLQRVIPVVSIAIIAALVAGIAVIGFMLPLVDLLSALSPGGGGRLPFNFFFGLW